MRREETVHLELAWVGQNAFVAHAFEQGYSFAGFAGFAQAAALGRLIAGLGFHVLARAGASPCPGALSTANPGK